MWRCESHLRYNGIGDLLGAAPANQAETNRKKRERTIMTCEQLVENGVIILDDKFDDYANVVLGPIDETLTVALGYVHTEDVTVSIDLLTDEATQAVRWFAYDITDSHIPGSPVGRPNSGYATRDEAVMALVHEHEDDLRQAGFHLEADVTMTGDGADADEGSSEVDSGSQDVDRFPYLGDDEYPIVIRMRLDGSQDDMVNEIHGAINRIMGGTHPEATHRSKVLTETIVDELGWMLPILRQEGIDLALNLRTVVKVDRYGDTKLDAGDPFESIGISLHYATYDDDFDPRDIRNVLLAELLEIDIYEPDDDDPEELVYVLRASGTECVGKNELGLFIMSGSTHADGDDDVREFARMTLLQFLALATASKLVALRDDMAEESTPADAD